MYSTYSTVDAPVPRLDGDFTSAYHTLISSVANGKKSHYDTWLHSAPLGTVGSLHHLLHAALSVDLGILDS